MDEATRDYIDTRIRNVEDKLDFQKEFNALHFELNEKAILKAENSMTLRLEGMNDFRDQLTNEREGYATKEATELLLQAYDSRLGKLENASSFSAGRLWMVMAIFAAIPTVIALIAYFRST